MTVMPAVSPEKLVALQRNPNEIRNVRGAMRRASMYSNKTNKAFRYVFWLMW